MKSLFCLVLVATGFATILEGPEFFGRSEYYLLDHSTWLEAEAEANSMNCHLVTINTEAENTWVLNTFSPDNSRNLWIGFTDQMVEGEFEWVSGQMITYTNWGTGNPDDQCGGQDYAYIVGDLVPMNGPSYRGEWDDCDNDGYMPSNTYFGVIEIDYVTLFRSSGHLSNSRFRKEEKWFVVTSLLLFRTGLNEGYTRYLNEEGHAVVEDCITGTEYIVAEKELNPVE